MDDAVEVHLVGSVVTRGESRQLPTCYADGGIFEAWLVSASSGRLGEVNFPGLALDDLDGLSDVSEFIAHG